VIKVSTEATAAIAADRGIDEQLAAALRLDVSVPAVTAAKQLEKTGAYADVVREATKGGESYLSAAIDVKGVAKATASQLQSLDATLKAAARGDPAAQAEVKKGLNGRLFYFAENGALRIDPRRALSQATFGRYALRVMNDGSLSGSQSPLWFSIEHLKSSGLNDQQRGTLANEVLTKFAGRNVSLGAPDSEQLTQEVDAFLKPQVDRFRTLNSQRDGRRSDSFNE
jgi:hypothetical protein